MSEGQPQNAPERVASPTPEAAAPASAKPAAPAAPAASTTDAAALPPAPERSNSVESVTPTTVYGLIHALYATVVEAVDTPIGWDGLLAPAVAYTIVKPIVQKFAPKPLKDDTPEDASNSLGAVLFALMANRVQFLRLAELDLSQSAVQTTRAEFCELLAIKILRTWPDAHDEEELTGELVRNWGALDGAPDDVRDAVDQDDLVEARDSAIELAIVSGSKRFCAQPLIQHLIDEIYTGQIVYQPQTHNSLIADNYVSPKTRRRRQQQRDRARDGSHQPLLQEYDPDSAEVYTYNPYLGGWLDYTRLRVPRWRRWIEFGSFSILLFLFVATLSTRDPKHLGVVSGIEVIFVIYTFGIVLDEFAAARESGWLVYIANAWNIFDLSFIAIFLGYFVLRIVGLARHSDALADNAFDLLSLGACILFPRLVFFLINNSVVILALRGMIATYINFMLLTFVGFSGICFCLWMLGRTNENSPLPPPTMRQTLKLLAQIWFGTASWAAGERYHSKYGIPILFVYTALCKTFLITMMMSMISQKYSRVYSNAQQEYLFQHVVGTLEGVKSDSVFSYLPGFNIVAVIVLLPLSYVLSPEQLHRVNVFLIRACNFPVLFLISCYERYRYRTTRRRIRLTERGQVVQSKRSGISILDAFLGTNQDVLIHAAFDVAPPTVVAVPTAPANDPEAAAADAAAPPPKKPVREKTGAFGKLFKNDGRNMVTVSAEEWNEVRESQKRLEELLAKVAAVSGV